MYRYSEGVLCCEDANLLRVAALHGTPAYVYSTRAIRERLDSYRSALADLPHRICYSVKANSNLAILNLFATGNTGFDIVSGGELYRVLAAGGDPGTIVFSGVGKTPAEIRFALERGIHSFNCESETELSLISHAAMALRKKASVAIRVNPDVDAATHPYISTGLLEHKFGIDIRDAQEIYARAAKLTGLLPEGVSCHIGSQILSMGPLLEACDRILVLVSRLRSQGFNIRNLDLGGGLGVSYRPAEQSASIEEFAAALRPKLAGQNLTLLLEPGRSLVAESGVLLTRVLLIKRNGEKTFVVLDAGMNDLLRPALYHAHHEIIAVQEPSAGRMKADLVGPVCESADRFAENREMPLVKAGDLLAIVTAGAYGFSLASNYNSRPRPCELLVDGRQVHVARRRETYEDLVNGESIVS